MGAYSGIKLFHVTVPLSDRGDTYSTSATWSYRQQDLEEKDGSINQSLNRGLTEENTQLGIISPIRIFKYPIGDILSNWGLVICSLNLSYQTHISPFPNWVYCLQLGIWDHQLGIIYPIRDWGYMSLVTQSQRTNHQSSIG